MNEIKIDEKELRKILSGIKVSGRSPTIGCQNCRNPQNNARAKCRWCGNEFTYTAKLKAENMNKIFTMITAKSLSRAELAANEYSTLEEIAKPYIDVGLAEPFALAIAKKPALKKDIMALWFSKWWQQYDATDILICSVLDGTITEDEGKWLNSVRSDHDDLAIACIKGKCTIEWAEALLNSGFNGQAKAVTACLAGGMPDVIAQISGFDVDDSIIPPPVKVVKLKKKTKKTPIKNNGLSQLRTSPEWKAMAKEIGLLNRSQFRIETLVERVKSAYSVFYVNFVENELPIPTLRGNQISLLRQAGLRQQVSRNNRQREVLIRDICNAFSIRV
jgi:hypothetical protein